MILLKKPARDNVLPETGLCTQKRLLRLDLGSGSCAEACTSWNAVNAAEMVSSMMGGNQVSGSRGIGTSNLWDSVRDRQNANLHIPSRMNSDDLM